MTLSTQQLRCPNCGAHLDGGERDAYACTYCGTTTPRAALVQPQRTPFTGGIQRLYRTVAADFDQDGWFEIAGWHNKTLHAIDLVDRTLMWTLGGFNDEQDLYAGPGRVYMATDGELTALNAFTGARVWTLALMNVREVHDPGYVPNGSIWARTHDDKLVAIDRATGARRDSVSANDSVTLFRKIVGHRIVVNDAYGLRILDAAKPGSAFELGTGVEKMAQDLDAGRMLTSLPLTVDSAHVHRGVLYAVTDKDGCWLEAYRVADGRLLARRARGNRDDHLMGAVSGHPITGSETRIKREPDGPTWGVPDGDNPEIKSVQGATGVLVVHVTRDGPGSDRHSLFGLDATSLTPIWQVDDIGYLMSEIIVNDERIVWATSNKISALDAASGAMLWETPAVAESGLTVGGGLVVNARYGITLLAETGEMMLPTDARTSVPTSLPAASAPEELPTWGIEGGAEKTATGSSAGGSNAAKAIALVIILAVVALIAVFAVKG